MHMFAYVDVGWLVSTAASKTTKARKRQEMAEAGGRVTAQRHCGGIICVTVAIE